MRGYRVATLLVAALGMAPGALAQSVERGLVLRAAPGATAIRLDGRLDEPAWGTADSIVSLTEVVPREGGTPVGRTVVRVLVDGPSGTLVIGVVALDPEPAGIVSFAVARDADLDDEDHVRIVLDTFRDGRSGYVFAVNPGGARFDALVSNRGESQDESWDAVWEAATARTPEGWSAEIRIPVRSLIFRSGLSGWGFNVERRVQRLQETSRWSGAQRDFALTHTSRAGVLDGLPRFGLGLGLSVRPSVTGGLEVPAPGSDLDPSGDISLDLSQRLGPNLEAALTVNTDFAETEVDTRQTNLTRFPLFFPEKRAFFLEGADLFDFGLSLGRDVVPFFSRRIGLVQGTPVPLRGGLKVSGRLGGTSVGALAARTGAEDSVAPGTTLGAIRVRQDVLEESSVGVIATVGDPLGRSGAWLAGVDATFQTSRFRGGKNFLVGVWGLATDRDDLAGDRTAAGFKIDYPNDLWDASLTYRRIGDGFDPSLGFVPRAGIQSWRLGVEFQPRPAWGLVRQMFYQVVGSAVTDLGGRWESYRVFIAPLNWQLESGDRFEANVVPQGERLAAPFEVADGVVIPPGEYHDVRYRLEAELAAKRRLSAEATWRFGDFFEGSLHELELDLRWTPVALLTLELGLKRNIGRLPQGRFTQDLAGVRARLNLSPDLQVTSLLQYDNESRSFGSNTRLRWTFSPLGDLFLVYNHNARDPAGAEGLGFESAQLLAKAQYTLRY